MMMKLLLVAVFAVFAAVLIQPGQGLDLGFGGVYNSPAAQAYWSRRFGSGVFAAARRAGQLARSRQATGSVRGILTNEIEDSEPVNRAPKAIRYVPTFKGTYGRPSPIYQRYLNRI